MGETHFELFDPHFDAISCQFALHYCFETEDSARNTLKNISSRLRPGCFFFGTTPDAAAIISALQSTSHASSPIHAISLPKETTEPFTIDNVLERPFGRKYLFTLDGVVQDCPEYLIPMPVLSSLAREYGLELESTMSFPEFYTELSRHQRYEEQLHRMGVIDAKTGSFLSDHERQVAALYLIFVFRRLPL